MPVSPSAIEQVLLTPTTPRRCVISSTLSRPTLKERSAAVVLSETLKASVTVSERPEPPPPE